MKQRALQIKFVKKLKNLKSLADKVFSQWIRKRDGHACYTCNKQLTKQTSQAGHYISRNHLFLRYDPKNVHCQCVGCNVFKKGNMAIYSLRLTDDYGPEIIKELLGQKDRKILNTRQFLESVIKQYK